MKKKIIIVLGSNHEQEKNVRVAMALLVQAFPGILFSRSLWTEPIGMERGGTDGRRELTTSQQFVNAIGIAMTEMEEEQVVHVLKDIERQCGRTKEDKALGIVKLDLDLLLYGDIRHKESDWERDYVKLLMNEMDEVMMYDHKSL